MKEWVDRMLFWVFVWSGSKLWGVISIYSPDDNIEAIHFAVDEATLRKSCWKMVRCEDDRWRK